MIKSDLKNGMVVELRNGNRFMFINDYLYNETHEYNISHYKQTLLHYENIKILDIVKVYRVDISNVKNIFKSIKLEDLLTDRFLKLIWKRYEVDWPKVPFGTKVSCWNYAGDTKYEGRFLSYCEEHENPFHIFLHEDCYGAFRRCELIEEPKEELKEEYLDFMEPESYGYECDEEEIECLTEWILDYYNVTRK